MKVILFSLASFAASVAAQTSAAPTQGGACNADYIVEACLSGQNARLAGCGENDWDCKCAAWGDIITCYNNCPDDTRKNTAVGQQSIFCGYASQFPSSTQPAAQKTNAPTPASQTTSTGGTQSNGSPTGSGTGAAKTNSAADLMLNAGGVLAAVAGVVAAVL